MTEQERELQELRRKVKELTYQHQLDMAEIVKLRRIIEAMEDMG
jgi:hypothetical protein